MTLKAPTLDPDKRGTPAYILSLSLSTGHIAVWPHVFYVIPSVISNKSYFLSFQMGLSWMFSLQSS